MWRVVLDGLACWLGVFVALCKEAIVDWYLGWQKVLSRFLFRQRCLDLFLRFGRPLCNLQELFRYMLILGQVLGDRACLLHRMQ